MTKEPRLKGKVAIVTAAGQGIGKSSAISMIKEGAEKVIAVDINIDSLKKLKRSYPKIDIFKLDVTDKFSIEKLLNKIQKLDILFNCAGFVHSGSILDCSEKDWDFSFKLNIKSMFNMCKYCLPIMLKNGKGSIINMSSVASSIKGVPNRFVYSTTKAAVIGLTKSIATDFIKKGIRANAISPGTVESPSWRDRVSQEGKDPLEMRKKFISRQPIGRVGTVEEIANLVIYLSSDESSFTTGSVHVIDGGWSM